MTSAALEICRGQAGGAEEDAVTSTSAKGANKVRWVHSFNKGVELLPGTWQCFKH